MTSEQAEKKKGFEGVDRRASRDDETYFNQQFEATPIYLEPGQAVWSDKENDMIIATLGSGLIVCIHDTETNMGAAGHIIVPDTLMESFPRFDAVDTELVEKVLSPVSSCIDHMKERIGSSMGAKKRVYIRLIGGSQIPGDETDNGTKNYVLVREYITRQGLTVLNEDTGGTYVRRVHFFPATGRAVRRMLRRQSDYEEIRQRETDFKARFTKA